MKRATGVEWIDQALDGGLGDQGAYLLVGPPFCGKARMAYAFALRGMADGEPAVLVTTDETAADERAELEAMDAHVPDYEKENLLWFVDTYSTSVQAKRDLSNAEYVDAAADLNKVTVAVNQILKNIAPTRDRHRLVLDNASTLATYTNPQTTFRFLQVLIGRSKMAGGTQLVLLDSQMHDKREIDTVKHLVDGAIEFSSDGGKLSLRMEGFREVPPDHWFEYQIDDDGLHIHGSLGEGRIP